tara:strand:+ start:201 stop:446 length:246 start_codon:yes stop_codon:yes gene_type:complete
MGYCGLCGEWLGYSSSFCEVAECEMTRKLIGLYGIKKIGETLQKVYVRDEQAIEKRTTKVDQIKLVPEIARYNLRNNKEVD